MSAVSNETRLSNGHKSDFMKTNEELFKDVSTRNLNRADEVR